ncbi:MAG: hypothetical protein R3284_04565 [Rubricoccaceae bacterium]|nr:hypothetical protein [Rubricoccaceae bacterium]
MLRITTLVLLTISVIFGAAGCSESNDTVVGPPDGDGWPPCPNYIPGLVLMVLDRDAPLADIDIVVRSFGLTYVYKAKGEVWVFAEVVEGDALAVQQRLSAHPLVGRVERSGNNLRIRFVVGMSVDDALTFASSYPEIVIFGSFRDLVYVEFEVTVGDEDEWVNRFLEEDLVTHSERAANLCPVE